MKDWLKGFGRTLGGVIRSRKFLTALLTCVAAGAKPEYKEQIITMGGIVVGSIALEDAAEKRREASRAK